jgi:Holliday junction DNA helicase RuvA
MELKDRLGDFKVVARPVSVSADQQAIREAVDALIALGYRPVEAERAVDAVAAEALTTEELLRAALKQLARLLEVSS